MAKHTKIVTKACIDGFPALGPRVPSSSKRPQMGQKPESTVSRNLEGTLSRGLNSILGNSRAWHWLCSVCQPLSSLLVNFMARSINIVKDSNGRCFGACTRVASWVGCLWALTGTSASPSQQGLYSSLLPVGTRAKKFSFLGLVLT